MTIKTILEPAREIRVVKETDVIVVGGGPGGVGAAAAAARNGADTVLIERYGYLGGMATGGLVNILPHMSDIHGKQWIGGLCQEIIERLEKRDAAVRPAKTEWGTTDRSVIDKHLKTGMRYFYVRNDVSINQERLLYTAVFDPEVLKDELNQLMIEANVKMYLHSWGTKPIIEDNKVKGVIFESKSGRQAVLGKVVIDSTGDGDMFVEAGVDFDNQLSPDYRTSKLAMVFWVLNVDFNKLDSFKEQQPQKYQELLQEITEFGGFPEQGEFNSAHFSGKMMQKYFRSLLPNQECVVWSHPMIPTADAKDVEELTRVEVDTRAKVVKTYEFIKKNMPGFENCTMLLTAPQLGTQGGRRIIGEYMLDKKDMESGEIFEDTIAAFPNVDTEELSLKHPALSIPYRTMIPRTKIENLIVACRAFSTSDSINHYFNLIPFCICLGQAAGTAAAITVNEDVNVRNVDYKSLQVKLLQQGAILPVR